ncbi:polysaccharide deacetylase family protein [Aspergillus taichungensis]|uniref:Polysaccharide deacetylase family protein n=1 Tax=Aspergillus taichungensis TaxID=482145 RepID=A0A2J5I0U1_9EURO|nr:polysaccharide deacetylase family protein [Aspergillus taichungensis]
MSHTSFLGLEGLHVFVTEAASPVGKQAVQEFLYHGCKVSAFDSNQPDPSQPTISTEDYAHLNTLQGNGSDEESVRSSIALACKRFGPINILLVNADCAAARSHSPIWDVPLETWEEVHRVTVRGPFLAVKHFLGAAQTAQRTLGRELENLAVVLVGGEPGLVQSVKDDIVRLNGNARINAVGLDERNAARPEDVVRTVLFLASHRVAGQITGQCLGATGRTTNAVTGPQAIQSIPAALSPPKRNKIRIAVSIDLDAVSGWLGTGHHPDVVMADYSSGFFAAQVGVPRLLKMLKKLGLADRCTWFIPGHSAESFPAEVKQVVDSGCEIGLHGYAHEGAYQMTPEQERDVLVRCIDLATKLTGKKPVGYRAPLYQLRESTLDLLEEYGFEYDASLTDRDCHPFFAPRRPPLQTIDFSQPASSWMNPIEPTTADRRPLVCVPCNWYMEDMTPMQYLPHTHNSHGYTDVRVIENLWRDRFLWIRENEENPVFPVLMHPDTSGMAHVIGMLERLLGWLKGWGDEVEFCQTGEIARWYRAQH